MKLKNALVFIAGAVVTAFVYIILSESFSIKSLIIGSVLGLGSMLVCVLFFPDDFLSRYHIRLFPFLWYLAGLVFIVIISGIKSLVVGFSKNPETVFFTYNSSIKSDMLLTLFANSITLTPGTTTIDKSGHTLRVMRLVKKGGENDLSDLERLEKMIKKAEGVKP